MNLLDFLALTYGGLAFALSGGMLVVGRNAIRRIRGLGYADSRTLWRLGMIRFLTATIVVLGLFVSASLLLLQVDAWTGLFGPADNAIGVSVLVACVAWYINAIALGACTDAQRDRSP